MVLIQQEQRDGVEQEPASNAMVLLTLQLNLLQLLLPMDCWIIGQFDDINMRVAACLGRLDGVSIGKLDHLLSYPWAAESESCGFDYRPLTENERAEVACILEARSLPAYVRVIALCRPDGKKVGRVLGSGVTRVGEINLCLEVIKVTLGLQVELLAAERLVAETRQVAQVDALTGLLNRSGWNQQLVAAVNGKSEIAVCIADLDCLKRINDSRGHLAGDELLKLAAKTLVSSFRNDDCVARVGGDEFAIMVRGITKDEAHLMVERLKLALSRADIELSVGVAFRSEGDSLQEVIAMADARMYEDKNKRQHACLNTRNDLKPRTGSLDL